MRPSPDEWADVDYELVFEVATGMPAMHEHLVGALAPQPGERFLDLAAGTGRIARLAAAAGADVTAQDTSPSMIETARRRAREDGLTIQFHVGDVQSLPYRDAGYDVVASAVGAIFAPDHAAVASELARVCRPGGRIGLTAWQPDPDFRAIFAPFADAAPAGGGDYSDWGRHEYALELLGGQFDLRFEQGDAPITGSSGKAIWDVWLRSIGSVLRLFESLDPERREQLEHAFVSYFERFRTHDGIEQPNLYLLILGVRRGGRSSIAGIG